MTKYIKDCLVKLNEALRELGDVELEDLYHALIKIVIYTEQVS